MTRFFISAGILFALLTLFITYGKVRYDAGYATALAEQTAVDLSDYISRLARIKNDTLDPSDDAAVLRELCKLVDPDAHSPECGGL